MSCYFRPRVPGATIFFTVCLAARGGSLLIDEIYRLRSAVGLTRKGRPFHVDAWVVLPDHMHCIWTLPAGDTDYALRWGAIKSRFTRSLRDGCRVGFNPTAAIDAGRPVGWNPTLPRSASKQRKGDAGLWQRRFWEHHVRGPAEYDTLVRYCRDDPVKHGLVARAQDWTFSSFRTGPASRSKSPAARNPVT